MTEAAVAWLEEQFDRAMVEGGEADYVTLRPYLDEIAEWMIQEKLLPG